MCSDFCISIVNGETFIGPVLLRKCALPECTETFEAKRSRTRCCSERHGKTLYNRISRADGRQSNPWNDRRRNQYHTRRARKLNGSTESSRVLVEELVARDGTVCSWCSLPIDLDITYPDPLSRSLDHIVPISRGGKHETSNLQILHLWCNSSKGNRIVDAA